MSARADPAGPAAAAAPARAAESAGVTLVDPAAVAQARRAAALRLAVYRLLIGLGLVLGWELAADNLIRAYWISSPSRMWGYFMRIAGNGDLMLHLSATFSEAAIGYVIGSLIGVASGFLLARSDTVAKTLDPFIVGFYGIPRVALAPLFIIWFGIGLTSKVVLVVMVVFFLTFFNTYSGVLGVAPGLKNVIRVMGGNELHVLTKVAIPATWPWIMAGLKMSVPQALVGAVVGEFIAASQGLGYLIALNGNTFNTTGTMTGIIILAVIVVIANEVLNRVESYVLRWRPREPREAGGTEVY